MKTYGVISKRDGEHCNFCGKLPSEGQLVIDHKDNDNSNNSIDNYQLLCRACNYRKNPRRPVDECESENVSEEITEIQINRTKEPQFKKMLAQLINEYETYPAKDLMNSIAERLDISPITVKRYLDKVCSSQGIYEIIRSGKTLAVRYKKELPFT